MEWGIFLQAFSICWVKGERFFIAGVMLILKFTFLPAKKSFICCWRVFNKSGLCFASGYRVRIFIFRVCFSWPGRKVLMRFLFSVTMAKWPRFVLKIVYW